MFRTFLRRVPARLIRLSHRLMTAAGDWLVPPVCVHCGRRRCGSFSLCRPCLRVLRAARPEEDEAVNGLPWIRAQFRLSPPLLSLIHGFKYRHQRRNIVFLCAWLRWRRAWTADMGETYDVVVPVPLHSARLRERGYNQAQVMAREIARLSRLASPPSTLRRVRYTGTQTRLGEGARQGNLEGAFRAHPARVAGRRFLLVDDVCTTGSTLSHCREELLRAGAARVDALVLARVERRGGGGAPDIETAAGFFS